MTDAFVISAGKIVYVWEEGESSSYTHLRRKIQQRRNRRRIKPCFTSKKNKKIHETVTKLFGIKSCWRGMSIK